MNSYSSSNVCFGALYDSSKAFLEGFTTSQNNKTVTINNANAKYIRITGQKVNIDTWQLEKGSKQNNFTPYGTTPIEPCKIGNYQDYFYKDSGKWYLHKEMGSKDLTSTNVNMFQLNTGTDYSTLYISKSSIGMPTGWLSNIMLCSHFKEFQPGQSVIPGNFQTSGNGNNAFFYLPTTITTLAEAKTYMDSLTNSKIYYVLATPINEEIIDTTLINQLNALESALSKDGQTNISQVNNNLPFIISAEAILSLKNVLDRIELLES